MYVDKEKSRLHQGDILEDLDYRFTTVKGSGAVIISILLPYVVVLTQDCDLERDFEFRNGLEEQRRNDKCLQAILICPAYVGSQVKEGTHLENIGLTAPSLRSGIWKPIQGNQNKRYHFLKADSGRGIPDIVVDFKRYYTIAREDIYKVYQEKYKTSLANLFREDLSQRFAYYLSRIGLPVKNPKKPTEERRS